MEPLGNAENFPIARVFFLFNNLFPESSSFKQVLSIKGLQLHLGFFELIQCAVNCKIVSYNRFVWGNWSVYSCDSVYCGSSLKARCHIQRVICVYKHMATHTQSFQQPPNWNSNTAILLLYPPALCTAKAGKKTNFADLGWDHLFYLDEENTHCCLQRAEFNFPAGASHL